MMMEMTADDIALLTDYLAGELSAAMEAVVDARLAADETFFNNAWPLMRAWQVLRDAPTRLDGVLTERLEETGVVREMSEEEFGTVYAQLRERVDLPPRAFNDVVIDCGLRGLTPVPAVELEAAERSARAGLRWEWQMRRIRNVAAAAIAAIVIAVGASDYGLHLQSARRVDEPLERRTSTAFLPDPERVETNGDAARLVTLDNGVRLVLTPNARLTYQGAAAALDGRALITVPASAYLVLHLPVGRATLSAGSYDISAPPGGRPAAVRVDSGEAHVSAHDTNAADRIVRTGETLRLP